MSIILIKKDYNTISYIGFTIGTNIKDHTESLDIFMVIL